MVYNKKWSIKWHFKVVYPQVQRYFLRPPLPLPYSSNSPLCLHPCQDVLLQDAIISFKHFSHKIVDGTAAFELVASPLLLDQFINQKSLHVLNFAMNLLLFIIKVFLPLAEYRCLHIFRLRLHQILRYVLRNAWKVVDFKRALLRRP